MADASVLAARSAQDGALSPICIPAWTASGHPLCTAAGPLGSHVGGPAGPFLTSELRVPWQGGSQHRVQNLAIAPLPRSANSEKQEEAGQERRNSGV